MWSDRRRARAWVAGLAGLVLWGCRSPVVYEDGLYRGREAAFAIAAPGGSGAPWTVLRVPDAALAFRGPGGETLSLAARCTGALARPRILARHLRFELPEHRLRHERARTVAGVPAWEQVLEIRAGEAPRDVATVTLVWRGCILDLVLVAAPAPFAAAREVFDAWIETLRLEGPAGVEGP